MPDNSDSRGRRERQYLLLRPPCRICGGSGVVSGMVDDIEFTFRCVCSGGSVEAVRWLLGDDYDHPRGTQ